MKKYLFLSLFLIILVGCTTDTTIQEPGSQPIVAPEEIIEETQKYECRIDSDCASDENCINRECNKINCPDGYITNHVCKKYECVSNSNCRGDETCENNKCTKINCAGNLVPQNHKCVYQILTDKTKYITPFNPRVQEKVDQLTNNDYGNESFGKNLKEIYYYSTSIRYKYDDKKWNVVDYWQTSDQTIEDGTGDCEDHAILLQSMIEYLLYKTYGEIPKEVSYIVIGCIDMNYDGVEDGCHAWNIIDASKLPENAYTLSIFDPNKEDIPEELQIVVNDITINNTPPNPKTITYTPSKDVSKTSQLVAIYWRGRKWVELEPTWKMPMSYYENKGYPYVTAHRAFNSQENYYFPDFVNKENKPTIIEDTLAYLFGFLKTVYNKIVHWLENINFNFE